MIQIVKFVKIQIHFFQWCSKVYHGLQGLQNFIPKVACVSFRRHMSPHLLHLNTTSLDSAYSSFLEAKRHSSILEASLKRTNTATDGTLSDSLSPLFRFQVRTFPCTICFCRSFTNRGMIDLLFLIRAFGIETNHPFYFLRSSTHARHWQTTLDAVEAASAAQFG